ncbi:MAG TPA: DUF3999 family protein [Chitinophagaceae bacterium]|nr:DUF3999 family protein [Chitinophagaceae bacterium]
MKTRICLLIGCLTLCPSSYGQIEKYTYQRELNGITDQWHKIVLPKDVFGKVSFNMADIRIFGVTENKDTIEVPYILKVATDKISSNEVPFILINQSQNDKGYYFTLEVPTESPVNQVNLEFKQQNFDWRLTLEGSYDLREWFITADDYRILSIKNEQTNYRFTNITFPDSKYRYFRLLIKSKEKPDLITAKIALKEVIKGSYIDYPPVAMKTSEIKEDKQTIIDIDLGSPAPVSYLKIGIHDTYDFYRPITIQYLTDSFKTEKGWRYNYRILTSGILSSIEKKDFTFQSTILQKLKIVLENYDNNPLIVDSAAVRGYAHELTGRFTVPAAYFLVYGNTSADKPHYDIDRFAVNVPDSLTALIIGDERLIEKEKLPVLSPLFQNKAWLWIIMIAIILLLGWFSVKMIKSR